MRPAAGGESRKRDSFLLKTEKQGELTLRIVLTSGGPVNFPGLGLTIDYLIGGFYIFGIHISLSGILIALALLLGLFFTERLAKRTEQNTENYLDLAIRLVLFGVVGARIGHVVTHWQYFMADQANVLNIQDGGMSFAGALIAGLIVTFVYCKQKKLSWLQVCDTMLPGVVLGQLVGKMGEFFERRSLGTYSDGRFAMQVDMASLEPGVMKMSRASSEMIKGNFLQMHPVVLYEILLLFILLIGLCVAFHLGRLRGIVLAVYLIVYGVIRFSMEFVRLDSMHLVGNLSIVHLVALALCLFGVAVLVDQIQKHRITKKERPKNLPVMKKNKN